ncbi:MAG TPA: cytochrome c oxidase subunit 3 [Polyangiaceae bacterium]|jgi:cytochrome c oxidase subunit 3|nr:cytochrome c oxidase subunit 3 [Polyangiaceae bacterium]
MSTSAVSEKEVAPKGGGAAHHGHGHGHDAHGDENDLWPPDAQFGTASLGKIGMWFFLCSDALSFGGLLLGYGILRGQSTQWIHPGEPELGINFTAGLTFLLICSSVTMVLAHAAAVENKRKEMLMFLGLTILGGVLFLTGQFKEYFGIGGPGLIEEGLVFGHSAYASTFYLITSFHGCHVLTGVIYLTVIFIRALLGQFEGGKHNHIEIVGLFWHFVDLVWIIVFTFVYLVPNS